MGFLEHIRSKPRQVKSHYAFFGALALTGIVAFVWTTTLPARLGGLRTSLVDDTGGEAAAVKSGFSDLLEKMQEGIQMPEEESVDSYEEMPAPTQPTTALGGLGGWEVDTEASSEEREGATTTPMMQREIVPDTGKYPVTRGTVIRIATSSPGTTTSQ